jgi:hypothetical protein
MFARFLKSKRVPNYFSGLFVLITINFCLAENFEIKSQGGNLLYLKNKTISFWNNKISYKNNKNFENELNFLEVYSDMKWFSTEFTKYNYSAKFDFNIVKPKITAGMMSFSDIQILSGKTKITNDSAFGLYLGSKIGVNIGNFEITPACLFSKGKFGNGDFQFFKGKPDIPKFRFWGLVVEYDKKQKIDFLYGNIDLDVLNNDYMIIYDNDSTIFQSKSFVFAGNYKFSYSFSQKLPNFHAILGFAYAEISADGSLTPANQQYFLFPYRFYDVYGNANAFAAWTGAMLEIQRKYLNHNFTTGITNIFAGEINADVHYKFKKFFGDTEAKDTIDVINLSGAGALFFSYSLESPSLAIRNKVFINSGMKKILAVPYGTSKFSPKEEKNSLLKKNDNSELFKAIFFPVCQGI